MSKGRVSVRKTVFFDEKTRSICSCEGEFWKTCSLRVVGQLPCQDAIISISPLQRDDVDPADPNVKSMDKSLSKLTDSLRNLESKFKI